MRWTKVNDCCECVFVNVPFKVKVFPNIPTQGVESILYYFSYNTEEQLELNCYSSIEDAKSDVENFILNHLAMYSAQVHKEFFYDNVMTWRKLKQQLDEIPEDQLDEEIKVLDTGYDWCGTPKIVKAVDDKLQNNDNGYDVTKEEASGFGDYSIVVEKGHYYLHTEL